VNSLLEQLGNEAVLVMYLAEELPLEDAAEVRQLLESDAQLRDELERLRAAHGEFLFGMAALDRVERAPVSEANATRDVARAIERWRVAEALRHPIAEESAAGGLRYPWWTYPMATAAAVLIAFLAWWGNTASVPHGEMEGNPALVSGPSLGGSENWAPGAPEGYFRPWRGMRGGRMARAMETWQPLVPEEPHLAQAEEQLAALSDAPDANMLFPPDANW
jgi:hypothetical protein